MSNKKRINFWIGIIMVALGALQFVSLGILSNIAGQIISKIAPLIMILVGVYLIIKG